MVRLGSLVSIFFFFIVGCSRGAPERSAPQGAPKMGPGAGVPREGSEITIGFSMDTLKEERWQRDRDLLKAEVEKRGGKLLVQVANGDDALQNAQAENLLTQGVRVLFVAPHNAKTSATIVEAAHKLGVPVIAYDRLILDADVDYYVSFDNDRVGALQAEYLVRRQPSGNYVLIAGAPTDNNALLYHEGQMNVLKPFVEKGQIQIVGDQWAKDWQASEALRIMENVLTKNNNKVDAVLASNDGLAGAVVQSLGEQKLAGKVLVSGQDAELTACQRVASGLQTMTVYKPIPALASAAAELALSLAKKQPVSGVTKTVSNGKKDVPSVLIPPVVVDKDNLLTTVIADGYHKKEDVFRDASGANANL